MESMVQAGVSLFNEDASHRHLEDIESTQTPFALLMYPMVFVLIAPAVVFQIGAILEMNGMQTHMRRVLRLIAL
jgi:hypothetical protein